MSGIAKLSEKMKKKISFEDYASAQVLSEPQITNTLSEARKVYALSKEDAQLLHTIFKKRLDTPNATSISEIMSEAIHLLYKHEC